MTAFGALGLVLSAVLLSALALYHGSETAEALTARADAALYMAKRGGRAQAVLV